MRQTQRAVQVIIILFVLAASSGETGPHLASFATSRGSRHRFTELPNTSLSMPASPPVIGTYFDHVVVIIMENEGIGDICRQNPPPCSTGGPAPYMANLANNYTIDSHYLSLNHTSQPNYIGLISGSIQGCTANGCPTSTAANLVDRFEAAGLTWKGYFENMGPAQGCDANSPEPYEPIHNPFITFQDITNNTARCNKLVHVNPTSCGSVVDCALINDLNNATTAAPNFMWLTPNDCDNMRAATVCTNGCTTGGSTVCIDDGDNYLKSLIPRVLNSRTFNTTRSALFLTFDEGIGYCPFNNTPQDCLYVTWAGPVAKTLFGSSHLYNHYSFTKTIETNWSLASLAVNDTTATPMTEFFKPLPPDFSLSSNPSSLSIPLSSPGTSSITVSSRSGFAGNVSLSAAALPSGLTSSLSPRSVVLSSGGSGSSTLTVSSSTIGVYAVNVTGVSGALSHSVIVTVNVGSSPDFTISSNPASLWMQSGSSITSTVQLTSLNGFSGTVSVSPKMVPVGLLASLNPTSVGLSSGGSGTSTLTLSSTTPANYTVTVTATSGSISHVTTVLVTGVSSLVASDAAPGPSSIFPSGGAKLIQDSTGKMIAVYADGSGKISLSFDNSNPMSATWSAAVKSPSPASPYLWPAAVLVSLTSLRIIAVGGAGAGMITDVPVTVQRGAGNNITGFTFGTSATLDSSGAGAYPSAVLAHNGNILLAWAYQNLTQSLVKTLRWDQSTGWRNFSGSSSTPDLALVSNATYFVPSIIERQDNFNVYLMANRNPGPPSTIAFNKGSWSGSSWSWGSQNLNYETNASDADDDPVALAWDPVKSLVVAAYGITGTTSYGAFTLNSQDTKIHNDTPNLAVGNRGWAGIVVNATRGDYYIFFIDVNTDGGSGPLGFIHLPSGGSWNATINWLDSAADNQGLSVRATRTGPAVDLLFAEGTSAPATLKFVRLGLGDDPPPVFPPGASLTASNIDARSLVLTWTPANDTVQVSSYQVYANGTLLASLPGLGTTYDVSGLTPLSHYLFVVQAGNLFGNYSSNGPSTTAFTRLRGDVNLDCKVNIFDLTMVAASFGHMPGDPQYNPNADLNNDGKINITDLAIVGSNFGRTC